MVIRMFACAAENGTEEKKLMASNAAKDRRIRMGLPSIRIALSQIGARPFVPDPAAAHFMTPITANWFMPVREAERFREPI